MSEGSGPPAAAQVDLLVVGGGINGAGVARDAAGRGLAVLLCEMGDLAGATSQWSTKLIHGGLRYLEHNEFRLVAESLAEREVVLAQAPHLVRPLQFVLPHEPHLRPGWMIRAGLFLYDHLARRRTLPGSFGVDLTASRWGAGLKPRFRKGFVYSDARVDDARLVLANALDARRRGATIRVRTRFAGARRADGGWLATLVGANGASETVAARAIVNAAGPWVKAVRDVATSAPANEEVRHVKGSHIVVPRVHAEEHAYILQNADQRIVFVIPYEERYSLIGTTDVPVDDYDRPTISPDETRYLLHLANTYLATPLAERDIVWTYSGVRPLYDDGASDPSEITRDYVLKLDAPGGKAPLVSIFGGKITTYRRLAEHVLEELRPHFSGLRPAWTRSGALPGGDLPEGSFEGFVAGLGRRYPQLPSGLLRALAARHGTRADLVLGDAKSMGDLGRDFGGHLTEREIDFFVRDEWATSADDVLWRRSKAGLPLTENARAAVRSHLAQRYGLA